MKEAKAFWTYCCDRCACRESVSARPVPMSPHSFRVRPEDASRPKGWARIAGLDLCQGCTRIVGGALQPVRRVA